MGRFDALTQLDKQPVHSPSLPEQSEPGQKPASMQTDTPVSMQARKEVNPQTSKPTNLQTSFPANVQTGLHANLQAGKLVKPEKYSSYLPIAYKKRLRRIAFETERHEYEVLQEAIELFFRTLDEKK